MAGQRIELPPYSMFAKTDVYTVNDTIVFGLMQDVVVPHSSDDLIKVSPGQEDRLDLISTQSYGTPNLWWVIARVNDLLDPDIGFEVAQQIRVPTKERLATLGILNV